MQQLSLASMWSLIQPLLPSIVTGIITGLVAVWLVPRHYYRQQWWQLKVQAYGEIIKQLAALEYCLDEWSSAVINALTLSDSKREALQRRFETAEEAIKNASAAGEFIVSHRAVLLLDRFLAELRRYDPDQEDTCGSTAGFGRKEKLAIATAHTIRDLRAEAQHDLRIRRRWPWTALSSVEEFPTG